MKCHLRNLLMLLLFSIFLLSPTTFASAKKLIPMGESIGIQLELPFVYVSHDVLLPNGEWLKKGDVIQKVNGKTVNSVEKLKNQMSDNEFTISIKQNSNSREISLSNDEANNILPFLKDETDGIGTLTFIDPDSKQYGALGHQIIDGVLNKPPNFTDGSIFLASIEQIKKSSPGHPGYKISVIEKNDDVRLGSVQSNNLYGVFGKWENNNKESLRKPIEIMREDKIKLGKAELYTAIEGSKVESFDIDIVKIEDSFLQFVITDKKLLQKTGGILQGMSGSPIIQDGQFVGAVTHMFVEHPSKGAAISVVEMLKKSPE